MLKRFPFFPDYRAFYLCNCHHGHVRTTMASALNIPKSKGFLESVFFPPSTLMPCFGPSGSGGGQWRQHAREGRVGGRWCQCLKNTSSIEGQQNLFHIISSDTGFIILIDHLRSLHRLKPCTFLSCRAFIHAHDSLT